MRRFVLGWKKLGHEKRLKAYIVNYADDLVICCRGQAEEALATMRDMMTKLKLTVNEKKTRVCKLPEEKFDFLGYSFGRCYSTKTGRAYLGTTPSKKRVQRIFASISVDQLMDVSYCVQCAAILPIGVLFWLQIGLEYGFENQDCCHLRRPIADSGHH